MPAQLSTPPALGGSRTRPAPTACPLGERAAADALSYQIPDFARPEAFDDRHTVVVGSDHSALTAISELARIAAAHPDTRVTWVLRRGGHRS